MINNNFTSEAYLINLSNTLGTTGMDYLTLKDGKIMREAITDLKSESAIEELEKILSYTNSMAKNIIEQGPPDFNGFTNKDEALALYGFAFTKAIVKYRISELKGENNGKNNIN